MNFLNIPRLVVHALLLTVSVFTLFACSAAVPAPASSARYVIVPGVGLSECMVGKDEKNFLEQFGGQRQENYWIEKSKGVDAKVEDGKITTMFFYFYSRSHTPFDGKTSAGIGEKSSQNDIIRAYGKPQRIGKSVLSSPASAMPGARETSLEYPSMGIIFTLWDGRLADIRVFAPRPYR